MCGLVGTGLAATAGCQHEAQAARAMDRRIGGLQRTIDVAIENEAIRPAKLARVGPFIERHLEEDAKKLRRDLTALEDRLRYDVDRFSDRCSGYGELLSDVFRGAPEKIEPTAIDMFY